MAGLTDREVYDVVRLTCRYWRIPFQPVFALMAWDFARIAKTKDQFITLLCRLLGPQVRR